MSDQVRWEPLAALPPASQRPSPSPQPTPLAQQPQVQLASAIPSRGAPSHAPQPLLKPRKNVVALVLVALVYVGSLLSLANSTNPILVAVATAYCAICMVATSVIYRRELSRTALQTGTFKKHQPLRDYGANFADFQYVFPHQQNLLDELRQKLNDALVQRSLLPQLQRRDLTDRDKDLTHPESRVFYVASSPPTSRGTTVTLAIHTSSDGQSQSVHWWILTSGFIDRRKVITLVASSPLHLPFWLPSHLRGEHDLLNPLRTLYSAFYNSIDIITKARAIHTALFDALVGLLDGYGIDTTDLKVQRAQILNVNISGGTAKFDSIMQGAFNTISNVRKGSRIVTPN
jgi:hypothetical protein